MGLAAFVLPSLDLSKVTHFTSVIAVPQGTAPVRFRIELVSRDKLHHWSAEKILYGGEEELWEVECPTNLRSECTMRFGVEMADRDLSHDGELTRWTNPRFVRRQ